MANITFGKRSLGRPTPTSTSMAIDVISAGCGVIITWLTTAAYIPSNVSNIIASILGLIILLSQVVKPLFGVRTSATDIPIEDVGAMDANKPDLSNLKAAAPNDNEIQNK